MLRGYVTVEGLCQEAVHARKRGVVLGALHMRKRWAELTRGRDTLKRKKLRGAELKFCTMWRERETRGREAAEKGMGERSGDKLQIEI